MANQRIKLAAAGAGVRLWEIAAELGVTDSTFSRRLRKELPEQEKEQILSIIKRLGGERHAE